MSQHHRQRPRITRSHKRSKRAAPGVRSSKPQQPPQITIELRGGHITLDAWPSKQGEP